MSVNEFVDLSGVTNSGHRYKVYEELRKYDESKSEKVENWPSDDAVSLQQLAGDGSCTLDSWYHHQFAQNESCPHAGGSVSCAYFIEHTPVLAGTMTGTIYDFTAPIQTFVFSQAGIVTLSNIGAQKECRVLSGVLSVDTGVITLNWSHDPGQHKIVISYEWDHDNETKSTKSKQFPAPNANYIDYLIDQLSEVKDKLVQAENKLASIDIKKIREEIEVEVFEEYDKRFMEAREFMVTKLDQYLRLQSPTDLKAKTTVQIFDEALES